VALPRRITVGRTLLTILTLSAAPLAAQRLRVGQPAPDFSLPAMSGDSVRLADLRGHPVVLSFWASWCPPCLTELPALVSAWNAQRPAGLQVLAINGDDERPAVIRDFTTKMALPFPVLLDARARVNDRYRITGLPTTVFIDSAGVVRALNLGPIDRETLARDLETILPAH
jgi:peroxiredoxin